MSVRSVASRIFSGPEMFYGFVTFMVVAWVAFVAASLYWLYRLVVAVLLAEGGL